jgi:uncharacterized protein YfcZ (UPF0381/DUF406 family)
MKFWGNVKLCCEKEVSLIFNEDDCLYVFFFLKKRENSLHKRLKTIDMGQKGTESSHQITRHIANQSH